MLSWKKRIGGVRENERGGARRRTSLATTIKECYPGVKSWMRRGEPVGRNTRNKNGWGESWLEAKWEKTGC